MAYAVIHTPPAFASAHNQCLITVFDSVKPQDDTTYPNYKYVADVYIDGTLVATLKAYPDPVQLCGVFDIGPIVRSYLESNFAPTTSLSGNQYRPWVAAQIKFGEEYDGTTYTNLLIDDDRKYFDTYKVGPWLNNDVISSKLNDLATNRPDIVAVAEEVEYHLFPVLLAASGTTSYSITAKKDGTTTGSASGSFSATFPTGLVHYNLAKSTVSGLVFTANFDTVELTVSGTTKTVQYKCTPRGHANRTIAFLNQYGGYETFDFRLLSRYNIDIERKFFSRENYSLGVSGSVSYGSANVYNRGRSTFASSQQQRWLLNSDWLNDGDYEWLKDLATSPETWLLLDSYWVPCILRITGYEVKTGANSKLSQLQIELDIDADYNTQYR